MKRFFDGFPLSAHPMAILSSMVTALSAFTPETDSDIDLGTTSYEFKDLYVDGVAYADAIGFGTTALTLPTGAGSNGQV